MPEAKGINNIISAEMSTSGYFGDLLQELFSLDNGSSESLKGLTI